ncbi:MAG TPA: TetR-like C-terminal domain-containing protein, partial [Pengzhenrongella sp.]
APPDTVGPAARVPVLLSALLGDLMADGTYDPTTHAEPSAAVRRGLDPVRTTVPSVVPADLLVRGLMAWTYLFGAVSFEVFGHRHNVVGDYEVFFDHEVRLLASMLGLVR